jgi:hypothetical protein
MPNARRPEKELTEYQKTYNQQTPRESWCGKVHGNIEEAIGHAERNLGMQGRQKEPYWGRISFSNTTVVGKQLNGQKRYRVDFAPEFERENLEAAQWSGTPQLKGTKGVHVNEENFAGSKAGGSKVCHPTEASLQWADTYWSKWTRQYRQR